MSASILLLAPSTQDIIHDPPSESGGFFAITGGAIMPSAVRGAAEREKFWTTGEGIVWAVIDSGIDAGHPQFEQHTNLVLDPPLRHRDFTANDLDESAEELEALVDLVGNGTFTAGMIAGELVASVGVELRAEQRAYGESGTSSVIESTLSDASGFAPRCKIVSLKVLDDKGEGRVSDVLSALTWIRQVNQDAGRLLIHGVNLGFGFEYDSDLFACGHSPLCVEVNELVKAGVVVVVAAGNAGLAHVHSLAGVVRAGALMSINDPGNAEHAITVGSAHADAQRYGVSYFSSRGPTLDGRFKPDIVAPGERMLSCAPRRTTPDEPTIPSKARTAHYKEQTGTSVATAFISGGIAALLSVRRELIGQPLEVKRLLAETAQDLNRDRYSQGRGAVDFMRALEESTPRRTSAGAKATGGSKAFDLVTSVEPVPAARPTAPSEAATASSAMPAPADQTKRFAVAISYPGERRAYVQKVVAELRRTFAREQIFYDRFYQAELVGFDLDTRLERIYKDESELLAVFISAEYAAKEWTGIEWRVVRDVMKRRRAEDVVPFRFDETPIPGLLSIDAFVDLKDLDPEFAAALIIERLMINRNRQHAHSARS